MGMRDVAHLKALLMDGNPYITLHLHYVFHLQESVR
jgi:hypothetical protein